MPVEYAQGDIFQVGPEEGYQFLLVFGHIGLNDMTSAWKQFQKRYAKKLGFIDDPFSHNPDPILFSDGKWIQFVPEATNHGMGLKQFQEVIDASFGWAAQKGLTSVITNVVKDTDHENSTVENKASDDRRVKHIDEYVRKYLQNFDSIKLISLNDAFTRNFGANPHG
jgi:hypothetical protein